MKNNDIEILQAWAQAGFAQNLVAKALTSANGVGEALSPQNLRVEMTNTIQRLSPEMSIWTEYAGMRDVASKFAEFNRITDLPQSGSKQGETETTPATNSKFKRELAELKIFRRKGKITDFTKDISRKYLDVAKVEMDNQLKVMIWDLITSMYFGNSAADAMDFDGIETLVTTNRTDQVRGGVTITGLDVLDDMIDKSDRAGGATHSRVLLTSPEMISALTGYETTIRKLVDLGKGSGQMGLIKIPGGHVLETYRGIPLVKTTGLSPVEIMTPTITLAGVGTGGHLSDGDYYIQVSPVTNRGEQLASAEQKITLSGGGNAQRICFTLSAAHVGAQYYKIYCSQITEKEKLCSMLSALVYDSDGNLLLDSTHFVGKTGGSEFYLDYTDNSDGTVTDTMADDVPLVANGGINPEYIILQDLDPIQGLGDIAYANIATGGVFGGLITTEPLAKIDAYAQFMMYSHMTLVPSFEATTVIRRGLRRK